MIPTYPSNMPLVQMPSYYPPTLIAPNILQGQAVLTVPYFVIMPNIQVPYL